MVSGRPRPVGFEIPMNVMSGTAPVDPSLQDLTAYEPPLDEEAIEDAAKLLGGAKAPLIYVGSGAQGASALVRQLAETIRAPVVGYVMKTYGYQVGPVILGVILGPMMDSN